MLDETELTNETVHIGSTVRMKDTGSGEEFTYRIVGSTESDPLEGKISDESPVGKAVSGHHVGEVVEVETPGGVMNLEIVEISR